MRLDIEKDAQDPHFLSNLSKLGAVRVDHHHIQPVRPVSFLVLRIQYETQ